jgi:hypothetical protein
MIVHLSRRSRWLGTAVLVAALPWLAAGPAVAAVVLPVDARATGSTPTDYDLPLTRADDDWYTAVALRPASNTDWDLTVGTPNGNTGTSAAGTGTDFVVFNSYTDGQATAQSLLWSGSGGYTISRAGSGIAELYDGLRLPAVGQGGWRTLRTALGSVRLLMSDLCGDDLVRISARGSGSLSRVAVYVVAMPRGVPIVSRAQAAFKLTTSGTTTGTLTFDAAGAWRATADYVTFVVVDEGTGLAANVKIEAGAKRSTNYVCPGD